MGNTVPPPLDMTHRHLPETIRDPATGEAANLGAGGAGVTVDNQSDPPAEVTTLIVPGATIDGAEATLRGFIVSETDPGAVGANVWWYQPSSVLIRVRNAGNDGWTANVFITTESVGDADANAYTAAFTNGAGSAYAGPSASTTGTGDANAGPNADSDEGDANVKATSFAVTGTARAGSTASRGGAKAGMEAIVDGTSARMGFFGVTEVAKPTVTGSRGANAALASLLTALANLGLITDSSS